MNRISSAGDTGKKCISADRQTVENLRKFFVFLRFRNISQYREVVAALREPVPDPDDNTTLPAYRPLFLQIRRRVILRGFLSFLQYRLGDGPPNPRFQRFHASTAPEIDPLQDAINQYCWQFCEADVCIGIASEDQEFMLTDSCFGTLAEGFDEDPCVKLSNVLILSTDAFLTVNAVICFSLSFLHSPFTF
jgi:hypothetical protein